MIPGRLETVAVIGNGIIGHGIAQIFAAAGRQVVMIGRNQDSLDRAMNKIAASLDDFAAAGQSRKNQNLAPARRCRRGAARH